MITFAQYFMNTFEIIMLAIALAMDCFAVSIVSGVILRRWRWDVMLRMGVLFGLFQALMPLLGWFGMTHFSGYIEAFDHWIAFGLLVFVGGKMLKEALEEGKEDHHFNPVSLKTQLLLSVATSIDALAIGITFSCLGYNTLYSLSGPLLIIGLVSLLFALLGGSLGVKFGLSISRKLKPEVVGGIILILIGVKILVSHLFGL